MFVRLIRNISVLFTFLVLFACSGSEGKIPEPDKTLPTVVISPDSLSGQILPVSTTIKVVFSKSMDKDSVINGFVVVPLNGGTIEYDDSIKTAIYKPSTGTDLLGDTEYTITLQNTIKDSFGNFLVEKSWSFTTEDNVKPTVIRTIPDSVAQPISTNNAIRIEFSEPMDLASFKKDFNGTSRNFEIKTGATTITGVGVDVIGFLGTLTQTDRMVEYKPSSSFIPDAIYTVTINTGVTDINGNSLTTQKTYSFKTVLFSDSVQPKFEVIAPVNNSKNNALNSVIKVKFTSIDGTPEVMDWNSINSFNFVVNDELGKPILGSFSHDLTTNILTFTPLKNLNLLDTYSVTLKDTITDAAGLNLVSDNNVASTFSTADGILDSSATQIGNGITESFVNSNGQIVDVHLTTKKDGSVIAIWEQKKTTASPINIMTKTFKAGSGWDATSLDITSQIVTTSFTNASHSLLHLSALVTDSDDNQLLIWRDKINGTTTPIDYSSYLASKWLNSTKQWGSPIYIHQGSKTNSLTKELSSIDNPLEATVYRSKKGTVSVIWAEKNEATAPADKLSLVMRQLKSSNGVFGSSWGNATPVLKTITPNVNDVYEMPVISADSADNIFVMYHESTGVPNTNYVSEVKVAKYPFPSTITALLDSPNSNNSVFVKSDSSLDTLVFSWANKINTLVSIYNPNINPLPDASHIVSNSRGILSQIDVKMFSNGDGLAVSIDNNGINYSLYSSSTGGWAATKTLEVVATNKFKVFRGVRDIITVVWTGASKFYVKRYKPGANFGWQPTISFIAESIENFNISSGEDGRTTIVWQSYIKDFFNPPKQSNIFALRIE